MRQLLLGLLAATALVGVSRADIAVSMNDSHTVLVDGNQVDAKDGKPDTVSVIDLTGAPKVIATIEVPGSVAGPPFAVAVAPDESYAIVTSATKTDPAATTTGGVGPDDRVSVIDLTSSPPKIVQSLTAGAGATTVRISPDGTLALIANRTEGTLSVFTIKDRRLTAAGKVDIDPKSLPSGIVFLPDGKTALLSRQGDHQVAVLHIDGTKVTPDKRAVTTALGPYPLDLSADGKYVAVGNMGRGDGDVDVVSLIDVTKEPFRTVSSVGVGRSPEGLRWAPDGRHLAVAFQNGTTKPPSHPLYNAQGRLVMMALENGTLRPVAEAPIGRWSQGVAFSRDGRTVLVQNMVERSIMVFGFDGTALTPKPALDVGSGPSSIMTPWK